MNVGIIGAGVAGLACAGRLAEHGIEAQLFDKGSRPGGRLSTRAGESLAWDFGAPCFTASDPNFVAAVAGWQALGLVESWPSGPDGAMVALPGMSSLVEYLGTGLDVRHAAQVHGFSRIARGWSLHGTGDLAGQHDALVVAVPAEQAAPLLSLHDLVMAREAASVRSNPCWTLLAAFAAPIAALPDWIENRGAIARAFRNSAKPGRDHGECWVVHASAAWSSANLECDREDIVAQLLAELADLAGGQLPQPLVARAHRWRFAQPLGARSGPLWNNRLRLGACGDWTLDGTVEGAWLSGRELADRLAADLLEDAPQAAAE